MLPTTPQLTVEDLGTIVRRLKAAGDPRPVYNGEIEWNRQRTEWQRARETYIVETYPDSELALSIMDHREAGNYLRG
jgi:hypothetical protein